MKYRESSSMWIPCEELASQAVFVTHFRKLIAAQFLTELQLKAYWHIWTDFWNSLIPETGCNRNVLLFVNMKYIVMQKVIIF